MVDIHTLVDRVESTRKAGEITVLFYDAGMIATVGLITPYLIMMKFLL